MLPHAPGVQMQATPEDAVPDDNVDEDTEDPDKRLSSMTKFINVFFFPIPDHCSLHVSMSKVKTQISANVVFGVCVNTCKEHLLGPPC